MKWTSQWTVAALSTMMVFSAAQPRSGTSPNIALDDENNEISSYKAAPRLGVQPLESEDNEPKGTVPSENAEEHNDNMSSFYMAVSMIAVSEIGDKTFLIAALMAMKNSKLVVFSSAFSSLAVMTVLSGIVGHALPTLISQRVTQFLASVLFVIFGVKLLREGLAMSKEAGVDEELAEVEEELASSHMNLQMDSLEGGGDNIEPVKSSPKKWYQEFGLQLENLASFILSPVWIQVFVMTFLGEWGDRSQIATIAMAAGSEYWFVILGAVVGHGFCTAAACIGGQLLATRISMRNVTLGGSAAFFVFAVMYFYDFYTHPETAGEAA
ncbi:uncharacterized protein CXQ87_001974 [Candidozyma duobushaemuli]|uniref:GDT1 family protein n=2 Tax=Candidozyma TaxID=3303203 RepID=A0ABX8I3S4_9ASCO|nr:uncharacterized protein CXQ87_001974 [[Candida] duobushaemulonis]PVH13856.1 hypothetical protein CXQ87_001974 [[Candida] duobushaemulonis]QWU87919.1 hypothetical protein CA3LBN_002184 [[Candida] haemuloni]